MRNQESVSFRSVLLQPDMIRVFVASLFVLGQVLVSFSLVPLYIAERGGDTFAIGLQTTVFAVASVVLRFIFGPMADTRGRRLVLAVGAFVFATANLAIYYSPSLAWMIAARVYQAVGMASYLSSASSLVADLAPDEHRGSAIGAYRMILPFASLVGPFLGNGVINRWGFETFFFAMAASAFFSFFVVLTLRAGRRPLRGTVEPITMRDFVSIFRNGEVRSAYLAVLALSVGGGIINTYIATYGNPYFTNPATYFVVYAFFGASAALGVGRLSDRIGRRRLVWPVLAAMGLGHLVLRGIDYAPAVVFYTSAVLTGIGFNAGLSVLISWIVDGITPSLRATALSLQESWIDGGFALGIFAFGTLSASYGEATVFVWTGIAVAASAPLVMRGARRADRTRRTV